MATTGPQRSPQGKAGQRLQAKGKGCGEENERAGTKDKEERHLERWALQGRKGLPGAVTVREPLSTSGSASPSGKGLRGLIRQ